MLGTWLPNFNLTDPLYKKYGLCRYDCAAHREPLILDEELEVLEGIELAMRVWKAWNLKRESAPAGDRSDEGSYPF